MLDLEHLESKIKETFGSRIKTVEDTIGEKSDSDVDIVMSDALTG